MPNYYEVLRIDHKASGPEIKSAYRRLARKLHPDRNHGAEDTARKFAEIAEAYEILGNPIERAKYDQRILNAQFSTNGDSVFTSSNPHARRWRQMVYEKRFNDIIDRMMEEERREAVAFQKVVYPLTAFLVSAFLSTALKPSMFANSGILGKIVIITLFTVGLIHVSRRLREGFVRFTSYDDNIHDSILDDSTRAMPLRSRFSVAAMLLGSTIACFVLGYIAGLFVNFPATAFEDAFGSTLGIEFILYPPIVTLLVDGMHSIASRFER